MRRKLVPCFDAFYGAALDLIDDWGGPEAPVVLDLGAGTGLFAALLRARRPAARLHLVDGSEAMLAVARRRFADGGVTSEVADMATATLGGPFDLVISALAIHHLDDAGKRGLFGRIHDALAPGGLFVNAEQVLGPTPEAEHRYDQLWKAQAQALGVPEAELAAAVERMRHDRCATVEAQLAWLRDAGFADVDCSFKAWRFAVLSGRRAA
jgi:trans-aconitate methyltransferase